MSFRLQPDYYLEHYKHQNQKDWNAGAFEYEIVIDQDLTDDEQDELCYWCAHNCKENFIVILKSDRILAGGSADNKAAWDNHKRTNHDPVHTLKIRLYMSDVMLFRMVWVD